MGLLVVAGDNGGDGGAQLLKLLLGLRIEQRQRGKVDSDGRVLGVDDDGGADGGSLTAAVGAYLTEEIRGVMEVGLLLGAAESFAALSLGLLFVAGLFLARGAATGTLGLVLGDALGLGLLVGEGLGGGLCLGLGGLALLLALLLGILGGIPRVENLRDRSVSHGQAGDKGVATHVAIIFLVAKLASADDSDRRGGGRRAGVALLFVYGKVAVSEMQSMQAGTGTSGMC